MFTTNGAGKLVERMQKVVEKHAKVVEIEPKVVEIGPKVVEKGPKVGGKFIYVQRFQQNTSSVPEIASSFMRLPC